MDYFIDSTEHLLAELERIDLMIRLQLWRAGQFRVNDHQFPGFFISEQEAEALLAQPPGRPRGAANYLLDSPPEIQGELKRIDADIARRKAGSAREGITLRLDKLTNLFSLSTFDLDVLLICLAPELDLRYERLYAYLQDDISKKQPSVDLVLNLGCSSFAARMAGRQSFFPSAPLLRHHLVELFNHSPHYRSPLLGKYLKLDERLVDYLLYGNHLDHRLSPYARHIIPKAGLEDLYLPAEVKHRLARLVEEEQLISQTPIIHLRGRDDASKQALAEALCRELGMGLLVIDGLKLLDADQNLFETLSHLASREALLQSAALYWECFDALLADERRHQRETLIRHWAGRQGLVFVAGDMTDDPSEILREANCLSLDLPRPTNAERVQLWKASLDGDLPQGYESDLQALASKFRFNGGEIRDAVAAARNLARWRAPGEPVTISDLYNACRLQSNGRLTPLTTKIALRHTWDDIVLPADRLRHLQEICHYVKYRARVYEEWGFERKLPLGTGLNIMFSGPSGTGKTLAAGIVANELNLDLAKIDLSLVVSKYIGETEKNLSKIFQAAESANVILFFDEADALFGKRSEVKDSHDRYANIEIGYLLQKLEEHEGIVIMASNFCNNIDAAFQRRMQFIVEFPFPDEEMREAIWRNIFPREAPLDPIDFEPVARRFKLAGGNIKNISVHAAFLAAAGSGRISQSYIMEAIRWEYVKMGSFLPRDFAAEESPGDSG